MTLRDAFRRSGVGPGLLAFLLLAGGAKISGADDAPPVPTVPLAPPALPSPPLDAPPSTGSPDTVPVPPASLIPPPAIQPSAPAAQTPAVSPPAPAGSPLAPAGSPLAPAGSAPAPVGTTLNLDELLAQVEGEYITRRAISRQIGPRQVNQADDDELSYEKRVHARLVARVTNRILVKAAERFGLEARPDLVDHLVEKLSRQEVDEAKERAERASPGSGAGIDFAKLLRDRGETLEEYKKDKSNEMVVQNFFDILIHGVPGKRAQFDPEPSPGDALRLFRQHPGAFDDKFGVRVGLFMIQPLDLLTEGLPDYDQALSEAKRRMTELLLSFVAGGSPAVLAKAHGVDPRAWQVTEPGTFLEASDKAPRPFDAWAFDPVRKAGDWTLLDGKGGVVLGLAVVERRNARTRAFDEICSDLVNTIRNVRLQRFQSMHTLDLLRTASVDPRSLIDEIEATMRDRMKRLDEHPVYKDIRMR